MIDKLNAAWGLAGCEVVGAKTKNRRVLNSSGAVIVSGGMQAELDYLSINHSGIIKRINNIASVD